jgi:Protein of unknown function (DUF2384)
MKVIEPLDTNSNRKKQVLRKALIQAANILDLNQGNIGDILGLSQATISRIYNNMSYIEPQTKEWELALIFLRMYRSLDSLFGGQEDRSKLWMNSYNKHLLGIPKEIIKKIQGLIATTDYLDAMRGKA